MLSKIEAKYIQSLYHKKQRDELSLFIVEGLKGVDELLNSSFVVQKIFAVNDWEHPLMGKAQLTRVSEEELQKISGLQTANKVLAIAEQQNFIAQKPQKGRITLALDGIQDPGNMGTLIRIADWFGIHTILASEDSVEAYNPKVIQSTMGSFIRVKVGYGNLANLLTDVGIPIFGALLEGDSVYNQATIQEGVLLIGNESKGIHKELLPFISSPVHIPRIGGAESLNAAVAAGILLSHLIKK
ncbi:RNA methyltransferase [Sediminibacterium sp.]|jgi:TrmH family RNA methyltransferase|uniref:TrmH family RNA methyltransferase n=1 Tax=Sediminibacterium sp. TaxID=1917865 RepID=UPI002718B059|nr:RNA methyltransferase [Sediminibacterium sp.]MDO9155993.1 RNA methyltransferase [Sediminibacterium sp.]MDP1971855.1 RNA methyltransferase [Sediminibacterium sp.]MDP2421705.1 RNA methyltransferase [Sediminibacterium sp.]